MPVGVAPVPSHWAFGEAMFPGGAKLVACQISTPVGTFTYFLSPDEADQNAEAFAAAARQVRTGITAVQNPTGLVGLNGQPLRSMPQVNNVNHADGEHPTA